MNDSDLLLRDMLDRLVPARPEDVEWEDVVRRAAGADESAEPAPHVPRAPRAWRRRALLLVLAAALTVAALAAWPSSRGSSDVVARAAAALVPEPGSILHYRADGHNIYTPFHESWQTTSGPTRIRGRLGGNSAAGPCTIEWSYDQAARTMSYWDAPTQTIYWHRVDERTEKEINFRDQLREIRTNLAAGKLREAGRQTINGREVIRLEPAQAGDGPPEGRVGTASYTYLLDAESYEPVRWEVSATQWYDYTTYEYLPSNEQTRQLLSVEAQHPRARRIEGSPADPSKSCGFG
jgi:hypothetical protein